MVKHKTEDGRRNLCGVRIDALRKSMEPKTSQRQLAEIVQLYGIDLDKMVIRRIENSERYVTDIFAYVSALQRFEYCSDVVSAVSGYGDERGQHCPVGLSMRLTVLIGLYFLLRKTPHTRLVKNAAVSTAAGRNRSL